MNLIYYTLVLPSDLRSFIDYFVGTSLPYEDIVQSLSVSARSAESIWGTLCKKVHSCNKPEKRRKLYLKWKNNSHNIRSILKETLQCNDAPAVVSCLSIEKDFQVSLNLGHLSVENRTSLLTSALIKDIDNFVVKTVLNLSCDGIDLESLEADLFNDNLLIIWASAASNLDTYNRLMIENDSECLYLVNKEGKNVYYLFNNTESQLWADGAKFYGLTEPKNISGFLEFDELCYFLKCNDFIHTIMNKYSFTFIERSPLIVLWMFEFELERKFINLMFGKTYVVVSNNDLNNFIIWLMKLRDEYNQNGNICLQKRHSKCFSKFQNNSDESNIHPQFQHQTEVEMDIDEDIPEVMEMEVPISGSGEFYLTLDEWESIFRKDTTSCDKLTSNWTNLFADKFSEINMVCVLKFKNYWLKKQDSRKVKSPFFRAKAECKFDNCLSFIFYIDDEMSMLYSNNVVVKFFSEGSISAQHTDCKTTHGRNLSFSERSKIGELFINNSVSKIYNKQFTSCKVQGFDFGNLTYLKSQDCLRRVKSELKSKTRFSDSYMEDISTTQQYFRYLIPESSIPGYVQYFVQDPFIIHMYTYKQVELLKLFKNSRLVLYLDATGSLISKPPSCLNKIFYYALTLQHPEYSTSPIPVAEMISSDHSTAEISHFLNKWCLNAKLVISRDLKIGQVEIDYSWAMIHSTCLAFNKISVLNYLEKCWSFVINNEDLSMTTILHLCTAHIMHRISYNLNKKFKLNKKLKQIILLVFGRMVTSNKIKDVDKLFELLCYILCSKKITSIYCRKLTELEEFVKGEVVHIDENNLPEEFDDEIITKENGITYREKSPFGRHFELINSKCKACICDDEKKSKDSNDFYYPGIIDFIMTYYMPLIPLWSGIILSSDGPSTDSNAIVENWFKIVKYSIFNSETGIRAADFIRSIYTNIDDRMAAF